ncbi:MAG: hypothetical protein HY695_33715 [Deltaproteobacteria bacterium]|nr:hypothetical protein [Deltaproteobacteria bacterium]
MKNSIPRLGSLVLGFVLTAGLQPAFAQEFYKGKTIRFIVGFSAGGGFDVYTRTIARHVGKHIPGKPSTVVDNMTGAGSLLAANFIYNKAKPDGLTIGNFIGGLVLQQVLGRKGIEFDARKFEWVGVPIPASSVCAVRRNTGINSLEQWLAAKEPVKVGGTAPGAVSTDDIPRMLQAALGLPLQVIDGYKGTSDMRLAVESGELAGQCNTWESFKATWPNEIESGTIRVLLQVQPQKHPELANVPNAIDFVKTGEGRQLIHLAYDINTILWLYGLPPGTPSDRVTILRRAFMNTMNDPEFLAEAKKAKLDTNPVAGDEVQRIVSRIFELKPDFVAKLKEILIPR